MDHPSSIQKQTAKLLEHLASVNSSQFDRLAAERLVYEAQRSIEHSSEISWLDCAAECGESLNLRIRRARVSTGDALKLAGGGIPVATLLPSAEHGWAWLLIDQRRGNRWRCLDISTGNVTWRRQSALKSQLDSLDSNPREWLYCQHLLMEDVMADVSRDASYGQVYSGMPPLSRLIKFLKPDRGDLGTILLFSMVVGLLTLTTPIAVEALVNTVAFGRYLQPVVILALIVLVFLAFSSLLTALNTYVAEVIQRRLFVRLVEDLAFRLPRAQQSACDRIHPPELVNRFLDISIVQKSVAKLIIDGQALVLQAIIGMVILAFYHPFLLGFDLVLLALMAFTLFVLGRGAIDTAIKESKAKYRVTAWLQEVARQTTAFRLNSGMDFAIERADQLAVEYLDARKKHFRVVLRQILFALGTYVVATTVLLGLGGYLVIVGQLSLGQLVAAELIVLLILTSFAKLGKHIESFYDLLASMDKIGQLLDLPLEPHNNMYHLPGNEPADIALQKIKLQFPGQLLFSDLTLHVPAGDSLAVLGKSGSGKSCLADFCCGLRQPDDGLIELDGIDLREIRPDLIQHQVTLARGVEIFAGTIAENIHLNRAGVTAADVRMVMGWLGLATDIAELPEGLATPLQTGGFPLSSGQCQKLMLARALVNRPRLVIFDGALDPLDATEARTIIQAIRESRRSTLLVMTKRLEIAEACQHKVELRNSGRPGKLGKEIGFETQARETDEKRIDNG